MRSLYYISIFFVSIMTISCEEAQEWTNDSEFEPQLVVEAVLTSEKKRHEVRLSETFLNVDDQPPPVDNALVALVVNSDDPVLLEQDISRPGVYLTDTIRALFGNFYTLYILHEGNEYFSINTPSFGAPVEPLEYNERADGSYEFIYTESSSPSMMEVQISWQELNENNQLEERNIQAFYYTLDVIDINKVFSPSKERIFFPPGSTVFRRKYSLTREHQEFLRSFLSEVDWRGSIFDVAPGNVITNISGGARGYFWVSTVRTDTQIVN